MVDSTLAFEVEYTISELVVSTGVQVVEATVLRSSAVVIGFCVV